MTMRVTKESEDETINYRKGCFEKDTLAILTLLALLCVN